MFGSRTRQLWKLHDELRERGLLKDACLVVDLSLLPGYFIAESRGVPEKCVLVDVAANTHLAIFVSDGNWEYILMNSAGGEPLPSEMRPSRLGPVGKSIAHDVLALVRQHGQEL